VKVPHGVAGLATSYGCGVRSQEELCVSSIQFGVHWGTAVRERAFLLVKNAGVGLSRTRKAGRDDAR
jgi:hypothetical protein